MLVLSVVMGVITGVYLSAKVVYLIERQPRPSLRMIF